MSVTIRTLEPRDRSDWERLFRAYITFYQAAVGDDVIALTWQRLIEREPDFHICLIAADESGTPVGLAHVLFHRSTWSPTWYCYLEDLFVDPAARKQGVGRALIEATYAEADKRGSTRIYWTTQEFNYRARSLYDQVATKSPFIRYQR